VFLVRIGFEWLCFVVSVFVRGRLSLALFTKSVFIASVRALVIAFGYLAFWQVLFSPLPKNKFCVKVWLVGGYVFFLPSF